MSAFRLLAGGLGCALASSAMAQAVVVEPLPGEEASYTKAVLRWEPRPGATSYHLEIDDDPNFRSPEVDVVVGSPSYALAGQRLALNGQKSWPAYVRIDGRRWDAPAFAPASIPSGNGNSDIAIGPDGTIYVLHSIPQEDRVALTTSDDWGHLIQLASPTSRGGFGNMAVDSVTGRVWAFWVDNESDASWLTAKVASEDSGWQPIVVANYVEWWPYNEHPKFFAHDGVLQMLYERYGPATEEIGRFVSTDGRTFQRQVLRVDTDGSRVYQYDVALDPNGEPVIVASYLTPARTFELYLMRPETGWARELIRTSPYHWYPSVEVTDDGVIHLIVKGHEPADWWAIHYTSSASGYGSWSPIPGDFFSTAAVDLVFDEDGTMYAAIDGPQHPLLATSTDDGATWVTGDLPGWYMPKLRYADGVLHMLDGSHGGTTYRNDLGAFLATNLPPDLDLGPILYGSGTIVMPTWAEEPDGEVMSGAVVLGAYQQQDLQLTSYASFEPLPDVTVWFSGYSLECWNGYFSITTARGSSWQSSYLEEWELSPQDFPLLLEVVDYADATKRSPVVVTSWSNGTALVEGAFYKEYARTTWTGRPPTSVDLRPLPQRVAATVGIEVSDGVNTVSRERPFVRSTETSLALSGGGVAKAIDVQISDILAGLPPISLDRQDKTALLLRQLYAIVASARAAIARADAVALADAVTRLGQHIAPKTDGCAIRGVADANDWIPVCDDQEAVSGAVDALVALFRSI